MTVLEENSHTVSPAHRARFCRLCEEAMLENRANGDAGIGTLAEKRLHAIIKRYLCEDEDLHEVGVLNTRYVSDVRIGNDVYEVQTGAFYPMRKKIAYYMEHTDCTVTVVHPIIVKKWISWVDPATREISKRKKSPKHEGMKDLLAELYCLIPYLDNPRLRFRLLLLEAQDFRMLTGRSRDRKRYGAERYERIPLDLLGEEDFTTPSDFRQFLPDALPTHFTVKDFTRHTGIRGRDAYSAVRVLAAMGLITPADNIGRAMAFLKRS
ncbi:MAG: hypothetical protein IJX80_02405 [Clostridia bacterium]|nr:hypothetical protein [Clostridia bacterium]